MNTDAQFRKKQTRKGFRLRQTKKTSVIVMIFLILLISL